MTTAYDVVRGALRLIGVVTPIEPPSAEESADGLSAMNQMLASWAASRYTSASVPQTSFALTSGVASYTIGSGGAINTTRPTTIYQAHITQGGIDYPLRVVALGEYEAIPDKSTTGSIPEVMAIRPGYPMSTLHLYPAPGSGCTLVMDKLRRRLIWRCTTRCHIHRNSSAPSGITLPSNWLRSMGFLSPPRLQKPHQMRWKSSAASICKSHRPYLTRC